MASGISFEMDKGWKRMARAVDQKRLRKAIKKRVAFGTLRNAQRSAKFVRKEIRSGAFAANSALTIHIKGSSKPLVDNGDLFKAITFKLASWDEAFVGVLATDGLFNIAQMLHDGGIIRVTDKMRNLFKVLWLVSNGADPSILSGRARELFERRPDGWLPLKPSTTVIRIPARPFVKAAFDNATLKAFVKKGWEDALERAFKDAAGPK